MSFLVLEKVSKNFGALKVLQGINLEIAQGEIFFLLGPSGCGKTTLLRILAGLTQPDEGRIWLGGQDITALPCHRRGFGFVFQNFALWPNRTVFENIAFGLRESRMSRGEIELRVMEALRAVRLEVDPAQSIRSLSGGQQQRVALARALVLRPQCLLLDEPLSNLDAPLRAELRREIRNLCRASGTTVIYVTHDLADAVAIADRTEQMSSGKLGQVDAVPRSLVNGPDPSPPNAT